MVSFGLAFGKGVVTGLGKQQERKWAKEAYEDSPEFQKHMLDIDQAKSNLKESGLDIDIKQKELADYGVDYKIGGFNFSLAGSNVKDPTQLAYLKLNKINDHIMSNTNGFRDSVLSLDGDNPTARALDVEFSYILPVIKKNVDPKNLGKIPSLENIPSMFKDKEFLKRYQRSLVSSGLLRPESMINLTEEPDGGYRQTVVKPNPKGSLKFDTKVYNVQARNETGVVYNVDSNPDKNISGTDDFLDAFFKKEVKSGNFYKKPFNTITFLEKNGIIDHNLYKTYDWGTEQIILKPLEGSPKTNNDKLLSSTREFSVGSQIILDTVAQNPNIILGRLRWAPRAIEAVIAPTGLIDNIKTLTNTEDSETDKFLKSYGLDKKLDNIKKFSYDRKSLSIDQQNHALIDSLVIGLAYRRALINQDGDPKITDKDFANALKQIGDPDKMNPIQILTTLKHQAMDAERKKQTAYLNSKISGVGPYYEDLATSIGEKRAEIVGQQFDFVINQLSGGSPEKQGTTIPIDPNLISGGSNMVITQ